MTPFPHSPFPRTEFDGSPCVGWAPNTGERLISIDILGDAGTCHRCKSVDCLLPMYELERQCGVKWNADRHVHSPPRDFPILRASPLWQQEWIEISRVIRMGQSEYAVQWRDPNTGMRTDAPDAHGYWFPPLKCRVMTRGEHRMKARIAFTQRKYAPFSWRLYSSPRCRCAACLENAQSIEIMLVGIAAEMQQWPDAWEHTCWFGLRDRYDKFTWECVCGQEYSTTNLIAWRVDVDDAIGVRPRFTYRASRVTTITSVNGQSLPEPVTLQPGERFIASSTTVGAATDVQTVNIEWLEP